MKILHIGAGKIGRGLILPHLGERHEVTVADRNWNLVQSIKANHGYNVIELDCGGPYITKIPDPQIVSFTELDALHDVDAITTAVLVSNLPHIAPMVRTIALRNKRPFYIIPMENSIEAPAILKRELAAIMPDLEGIFVLGSVIDRIVPALRNELDVECERYSLIKIEDADGFGQAARDERLVTKNIRREFDKKFLLVNGLHACAAYLGYQRGHQYICDVMGDPVVRGKLELIGRCYIRYLMQVYGYREDELTGCVGTSLMRFSNPYIKDPLGRVGGNLLVKLSPTDRIMRPLLFNKNNGLEHAPLEEVVEAAGHFRIANDYDLYLPLFSPGNYQRLQTVRAAST